MSVEVLAATVITFAAEPGEPDVGFCELQKLFPAAATTTIPFATALLAAITSESVAQTLLAHPPPKLMLITVGRGFEFFLEITVSIAFIIMEVDPDPLLDKTFMP